MTVPPEYVPCDLLEYAADFGIDEDPIWLLASDLAGAVRLSRAIDQHEQARAIARMLRRSGNDVPGLAKELGVRTETLSAKLRGLRPAREKDLITWSWMTGEPRRHRPLSELLDGVDAGDLLPIIG